MLVCAHSFRRYINAFFKELIDGIYEEATGAQSAAVPAATPFEESWDAIFGDYSVADLDKECGVSGLAFMARIRPERRRMRSPVFAVGAATVCPREVVAVVVGALSESAGA